MLDKRITYIVCWYKTLYKVSPIEARGDAGSNNRRDDTKSCANTLCI